MRLTFDITLEIAGQEIDGKLTANVAVWRDMLDSGPEVGMECEFSDFLPDRAHGPDFTCAQAEEAGTAWLKQNERQVWAEFRREVRRAA